MANLKNITLNYEDGTSKTFDSGMFCGIEDKGNGETDFKLEFANASNADVVKMVTGIANLGVRMGMFGKLEEE